MSDSGPHDFRDHKAHMQWQSEKNEWMKQNKLVPSIPLDMAGGSKASSSSVVMQKALSNPLVPAGMLATTGCLVGMLVSALRRQNSMRTQWFMRGRIFFQGLTVVAMVTGAWVAGNAHAGPSMKPVLGKQNGNNA
ncbi:hypothetical protein PRIPAC_81607 [Pristionchus pacificus]|uniref:HIG1 domain-containing protein n=1 Tax=Pristionchus pacificus TaxID=54126 RepID=A0A2A6BHE6_PRIPA|nr:hypothetical protein PRIPAC_81607 [Pristionchus pacificus]|eukprot:PDM65330.1 hypothetical protein PRIPAC_52272 [Pristionchus pacificus]